MIELRTAREIALERADSRAHIIPPITDEKGRYWQQPSRFSIEVDDKYALMSHTSFVQLKEYSALLPTGTYFGKMWKCERPWGRPNSKWFLCWYYDIGSEKEIGIKSREIIIV